MNPEMINTSTTACGDTKLLDIRLQTSNCNGDDFLRRQISIRASRSGRSHEVIWTLPDRLLSSPAGPIIYQEILAEFQERFPDES